MIWFLVEAVVFIVGNIRKNSSKSKKKNEDIFHTRWLIALIITVVGSFFSFVVFIGDKPGMSETAVLTLVSFTIFIVSALHIWLIVESVLFIKKNKDALPMCLITIFFSLNILFVLFFEITFGLLDLPTGFLRNGRPAFYLISVSIFLGLSVWSIAKGTILIKDRRNMSVATFSIIIGIITVLIALRFVLGAIKLLTTEPLVINPVR